MIGASPGSTPHRTEDHTMRPRSLRRAATVASVLVVALTLRPQAPLRSQPPVPEGATLEKLFDGGLVLTEGVAVAPDGQVFFSDITFTHVSREKNAPVEAGHVWRYDPATGK